MCSRAREANGTNAGERRNFRGQLGAFAATSLEHKQPPLRIELHANHPRKNWSRIAPIDDARREQKVVKLLRDHVVGTLPIQKLQNRWPRTQYPIPLRARRLMLLHIDIEIQVKIEIGESVGRTSFVSKAHNHLTRL